MFNRRRLPCTGGGEACVRFLAIGTIADAGHHMFAGQFDVTLEAIDGYLRP